MSDEATRKNILAIKYHSDVTREQVAALRAEVKAHADTLETLRATVQEMETQVRLLQIKLYSGGATNGNLD